MASETPHLTWSTHSTMLERQMLFCALEEQYISLDILLTAHFFDLLTFVHRCIMCIWAASFTSARPPSSHDERLAIRDCASWSSSSSAGLILVCFFDFTRCSVVVITCWAASNCPASLHAAASFNASVTSM